LALTIAIEDRASGTQPSQDLSFVLLPNEAPWLAD
jgi:hypothetical protein